ncbi:MAG TPA: hypothetical protein VH165_25345 [Kofleriaceae bacterium]|nr:hypothetical protein [Kofleriaceae bacterium]
MRWLALCLLIACENAAAPPPPAPPSVAPREALQRIEDLPKIMNARDPTSPYDCTVIATLQTYFAGTRLESCGLHEVDATPAALAATEACATQAIAARRPVIFGQAMQGIDSGGAVANLARTEHATYTGYSASFDSNPCGGGCGELGGTHIVRCTGALRVANDCYARPGACLAGCTGPVVETCRNGKATAVRLADAEAARDLLFGPTPASLGPAFGPLQLGAPVATWKTDEAARAIQAVEAGGIVWLGGHRAQLGPAIDSIAIGFAGPCSAIRATVVARWGATPDGMWVDAAAHRRARLDLDPCQLRVDRYVDLDTWIADTPTAVFPLGAIGTRAQLLATRVGAVLDHDGGLRWTIPGFGRASGVVDVEASVEHGRIVGLQARGAGGDATLDLLRARLTALRGPPLEPDVWRGKLRLTAEHGTSYRDDAQEDGFEFEVYAAGPR